MGSKRVGRRHLESASPGCYRSPWGPRHPAACPTAGVGKAYRGTIQLGLRTSSDRPHW